MNSLQDFLNVYPEFFEWGCPNESCSEVGGIGHVTLLEYDEDSESFTCPKCGCNTVAPAEEAAYRMGLSWKVRMRLTVNWTQEALKHIPEMRKDGEIADPIKDETLSATQWASHLVDDPSEVRNWLMNQHIRYKRMVDYDMPESLEALHTVYRANNALTNLLESNNL